MKTLKFDKTKAPRIYSFMADKEVLIKKGRTISADIEKVEEKIQKQNDIERNYTNQETDEIKEMVVKGNAIQKEIEDKIDELEKMGKAIMAAKLALIPKDETKKHFDLRAAKEELERERNKIFLKVQKIKDKLVPLIRKLVIPHLEQYEDIETGRLVGEKIVITVFSHLEEWKAKFAKRENKAPVAPETEPQKAEKATEKI